MKRSNKKPTGARYKTMSKKTRYQRGRDAVPATIGPTKIKKKRARGDSQKLIVYRTDVINVISEGKAQKAKILNVIENPADPHFVRRNVMTKGAIVETDVGKVRITSRPGQHGVINGVLVEGKK